MKSGLLYDDVRQRLEQVEMPWSSYGIDPYGLSKSHLRVWYTALGTLYRHYFGVRAHGVENVPPRGRAMLVGNHSGGVALDAAMVIATCFFEMDPPRVAQGMADKFINRIPFASQWSSRLGQFTGLPEHAVRLLRDGRLLLVFPEGARGTAKLFWDRHSLVDFGTGFMRLALQTGTPIVPFAFVGGGDAIPTVANAYKLGRLVGAPYLPITPWILPVPIPVPLSVHFGKALRFEGTGAEDDETIERYVAQVKDTIARLLDEGRRAPLTNRLAEGPQDEARR